MFNELVAESFTVLCVTDGQFRTAARFADQQALRLPAGDALQLAIASEHGAAMHTLDQRLANAEPALGVPAQLEQAVTIGRPTAESSDEATAKTTAEAALLPQILSVTPTRSCQAAST